LKKLLLLISITLPLLAFGQQRKLVAAYAAYDDNAVPELYNRTPIGIQLTYSDSSKVATANGFNGSLRWNKMEVKSSNGEIRNGILTFDRSQLVKDNYHIKLTITLPGENPITADLELPQLTGMRFNHYADSLKRNIHFYLNVEGMFSTGKILPLDTNEVHFQISAGKLIGQDLLLPAGDTTKIIRVEAWYKLNPAMYLLSDIPVKQMPDKN